MRRQPGKVNVLVVDDNSSFRETAREVVDSTPGFVFAGEAASGEQALELIAASPQPDLVLMDVRMPGMGGIAASRKIRQDFPHVEVVVLSQLRDSDRREVASALRCVVVGKENLSSEFLRALWQKRTEIDWPGRLSFQGQSSPAGVAAYRVRSFSASSCRSSG